jgi:cardiolipin synthase A/B
MLAATEADRLRRIVEGVIGVPATEGNRVDVLRNGVEIFPAMLGAIESSRHTVDFLTFVYWTGDVGTTFAKALAGRAREGVRVRVVLDGWGAESVDHTLVREMESAGVQLRWFRPLRRFRPSSINHRTHRKLLICDEAVGFTGGVGIADEWLGDAADEHEWRDTHFRVRGPAVDGLRAAFLDNWLETSSDIFDPSIDRFPDQPQDGDAVVQVVRGASEVGTSDICTLVRALVQVAEERIRITTAYFVPGDELVGRLCDAADRGVNIEVLLPGPHADKRFVQLAGEAAYEQLLAARARVWCYQPSMLHAKVLTIDGLLAVVGSANLNSRSVALDEEVDLVVIDPDVTAELDRHFDLDIERSTAIDLTRWRQRSGRQRVAETVSTPLRRWF